MLLLINLYMAAAKELKGCREINFCDSLNQF